MLTAPFRQFLISPPRSWSIAALALIGTCSLHAQAPAGSPTQTLGTKSQSEVQDNGPDGANIKVNFINTPIMGIIPVYQQITGKKMILDSQLQGETLKIVGVRPMTKKEAVAFIDASLLLNGYAIIEKDPETVMLIHASGGKSPTPEGLPVYSSIRDLPETERIVHYVLPLQNISPDEATKAFTTVIKLHAYGAITPVNNTSNIIITENSSTIRSIYDLAQVIDVPPAESATELIELKRSDAEKIADIIKEIYEEKEKADASPKYRGVQGANQGGAAVPGAPVAPVMAGGAGTSNATNPSAAKVRIIPDRRTNSLLVQARPVDIAFIKSLIEKLDREASDSNFLERKLKYMPVTEFLAVARDALSRDTDISSDNGGSSGGAGNNTKAGRSHSRRTSGSTNTPSTDAAQNQRNNSYGSNGFGGQSGGGSGGSFGGGSHTSLGDPEVSGAPESVVVGKTLLIADARSNTLIVNGSPEHVRIIDKLIERMDLRPQQIYISTIIAQVNLGKQFTYGLDAIKALDDFSVRQGNTLPSTTDPDTGLGTGTGVAAGAAAGVGGLNIPINFKGYDWNKLNLYGQLGSLSRYIHLLEGDKNFKLLSRPSFYLRNNEKATISSGQRIAVPVSTLSNVGAGVGNTASVSSSIEYRDVVLKLEVIPLINSNDEVTLQIAQVNDNITGQQLLGS
ncbi:MAG: Type secretion system protein, partial [Verrucomicrobiaceae bacterium]|nr:Type secretion system protein [Verrucomicrobiaceae bacterium]